MMAFVPRFGDLGGTFVDVSQPSAVNLVGIWGRENMVTLCCFLIGKPEPETYVFEASFWRPPGPH
jgi:hypothetical protein